MASTYSPLKIELIGTGDQSGTWGNTTNTNLGTALEEAITGSADVTFVSANVTLTLTDTNSSQTARNLRLRLTGTTGGARNLIVPTIEKQYLVQNDTADTITIKNATGTGVAIPTGMSANVFNNGVNITSAGTYSTSLVTPLLAATDAAFVNPLPVTSGGTGGTTATGTGAVVRATSPTITGATLTTAALNGTLGATTPSTVAATSGTFSTTLGVTGVATFTAQPILSSLTASSAVATDASKGLVSVTNTGSGNNVLATSPTLVTPVLGTPSSGTLTSCTGLPISTGVSGLGAGVATFLATPSSANLLAAVTGDTGTGNLVFATSPTITGATLTTSTVNNVTVGTNAGGAKTVSTSAPTGGAAGDIWYQY